MMRRYFGKLLFISLLCSSVMPAKSWSAMPTEGDKGRVAGQMLNDFANIRLANYIEEKCTFLNIKADDNKKFKANIEESKKKINSILQPAADIVGAVEISAKNKAAEYKCDDAAKNMVIDAVKNSGLLLKELAGIENKQAAGK